MAETRVKDESENESIPYKYSITSYGADYPVDSLVSRLDKDVVAVPTFQRKYVWNERQASRFIESLLLGLRVPGIFLSKEPDTGKLLIIDGQQRLRTLQAFYSGILRGKAFELHEPHDGPHGPHGPQQAFPGSVPGNSFYPMPRLQIVGKERPLEAVPPLDFPLVRFRANACCRRFCPELPGRQRLRREPELHRVRVVAGRVRGRPTGGTSSLPGDAGKNFVHS